MSQEICRTTVSEKSLVLANFVLVNRGRQVDSWDSEPIRTQPYKVVSGYELCLLRKILVRDG